MDGQGEHVVMMEVTANFPLYLIRGGQIVNGNVYGCRPVQI